MCVQEYKAVPRLSIPCKLSPFDFKVSQYFKMFFMSKERQALMVLAQQ